MKHIHQAILLFAVVVLALSLESCFPQSPPEITESITMGDLPLMSSALIYIAEHQGYFAQNGLAVTLAPYGSGVASMDALLEGKADLATMTEFVLVRNALQKQPVSIVGTMNRSLTMEMIGLEGRGISTLADLKGRRIGLTRGAITEFYLGRLLDLHGMSIQDVALVDLPQSEWMTALSSGSVDAIVGWPPYSTQIEQQFPQEIVTWPVQSEQPLYGVVAARNDWIEGHPAAIPRFWKSLAQAEGFLAAHPAQARAIVRTRLEPEHAYLDSLWGQYSFSLSLDQSLILAMEDEARWTIDNNLTPEKQVPNFLDYVYENGLRTVKPAAVNIIR